MKLIRVTRICTVGLLNKSKVVSMASAILLESDCDCLKIMNFLTNLVVRLEDSNSEDKNSNYNSDIIRDFITFVRRENSIAIQSENRDMARCIEEQNHSVH